MSDISQPEKWRGSSAGKPLQTITPLP